MRHGRSRRRPTGRFSDRGWVRRIRVYYSHRKTDPLYSTALLCRKATNTKEFFVMPRVRISLNGPWEFVPDPKDAYQPDHLPAMRPIAVPGGWENQFPGEAGTFGRAWY